MADEAYYIARENQDRITDCFKQIHELRERVESLENQVEDMKRQIR